MPGSRGSDVVIEAVGVPKTFELKEFLRFAWIASA